MSASAIELSRATISIIRSSASAHISGEEVATRGSVCGSTPCRVPYCGSAPSKSTDSSNATRRSRPDTSMASAVTLCVLRSRPR